MRTFGRGDMAVAVLSGVSVVAMPPSARADAFQGETGGYFFNLSGLGHDLGAEMAQRGIYFSGNGEVIQQSVASGGDKRSTQTFGISFIGTDLDLNKLAGIPGGRLHIVANAQYGQSSLPGTVPSGTFAGSASWVYGDELRLEEFAYEQRLANDKVRILAGRLSPHYVVGGAFDAATWQCNYVSYSCGDTGGFALDGQKPAYNLSSWASTLTVLPTSKSSAEIGIYEYEPQEATDPADNGWPGRDWGLNYSRGAYIPMQVTYQTDFSNSSYPGAYLLGGYVDTAQFDDPYLNVSGRPIPPSGGEPQVHDGDTGVWFSAQQMVYRPSPRSQAGLSLFVAANLAGSGHQTVQQQWDAGITYLGPLLTRPNDSINVLAIYDLFDPRTVESGDAVLARLHESGNLSRTELIYEVNYGFVPAPGITFRPYLQYVKDPDQLGSATFKLSVPNAVIAGVMLQVNANVLLGLPRLGL